MSKRKVTRAWAFKLFEKKAQELLMKAEWIPARCPELHEAMDEAAADIAQALAAQDRAGYELGFNAGRNRGLEEAALQVTSGWAPAAPPELQILAQRIRALKVKP